MVPLKYKMKNIILIDEEPDTKGEDDIDAAFDRAISRTKKELARAHCLNHI